MVIRVHAEELHLRAAQRPAEFGECFSNAIEERVCDLSEVAQEAAGAQSVNLIRLSRVSIVLSKLC